MSSYLARLPCQPGDSVSEEVASGKPEATSAFSLGKPIFADDIRGAKYDNVVLGAVRLGGSDTELPAQPANKKDDVCRQGRSIPTARTSQSSTRAPHARRRFIPRRDAFATLAPLRKL